MWYVLFLQLHDLTMLHNNNNNYLSEVPSFNHCLPFTMPTAGLQMEGEEPEETPFYDNSIQENRMNSDNLACQDVFAISQHQNAQYSNNTFYSPCQMSNISELQGPPDMQTDPSLVWKDVPNPRLLNQPIPASGGAIINAGYSFTFTTPTQLCQYSPALTATTQNRFYYSRATPQTFAPSGFTHWQHAVPPRISWTNAALNIQQGVSIFTGGNTSGVQTHYACSVAQPIVCSSRSPYTQSPVPSCSQVPRRPKRHSSENLEYLSPTNKVHLTEEKIANHMQELSIHCASPSQASIIQPGTHSERISISHQSTHQPLCKKKNHPRPNNGLCSSRPEKLLKTAQQEQWQSFKDLEERLELSEDDEHEDGKLEDSLQPKLHIVSDIPKMIQPHTIIPKDILQEIERSRMEIVLWKPPADAVKKIISSHKDQMDSDVDAEDASSNQSDRVESNNDEDGYMDTEMLDDVLML